jgi:hypothetical protein
VRPLERHCGAANPGRYFPSVSSPYKTDVDRLRFDTLAPFYTLYARLRVPCFRRSDEVSVAALVLMIQLMPNVTDIQQKFNTLAYQAMAKLVHWVDFP